MVVQAQCAAYHLANVQHSVWEFIVWMHEENMNAESPHKLG